MTENKLLLDILQVEWEESNTFGLTPDITFGWFDDDKDIPQLTIGQPEESPTGGGETGFSGLGVDGPTQRIVGTIDTDAWCRPGDLKQASTRNPRQYNSAVADEVQRILEDYNDKPTNPRTGEQPVNFLSYGGRTPVPEPDDTLKMVRHYNVIVNYGYGPNP